MTDQFTGIKGGVLIIGSLLMADDLDEPGDEVGKNWRSGHLLEKQGIQVIAPIRYGRQSSKGEITMVFPIMPRSGRVVPGCSHFHRIQWKIKPG